VIGGIDGGWMTVIVLVLVLMLGVVVTDVDDGVVSLTVAGGTALVVTPVVTVDVETEVETDVPVALAGLSTPHASRWSDPEPPVSAL
jgi:hypothetical protein